MSIYTRKGDFGETGIRDGTRLTKDDPLIEAIGTVDELNAAIGSARVLAKDELRAWLGEIQDQLFSLGAELANSNSKNKIPLNPPFSKGEKSSNSPLWKRGGRPPALRDPRLGEGDFKNNLSNQLIQENSILQLEQQIDAWQSKLPKLTQFILPGGSELAARIHLARTITRRAERRIVTLRRENPASQKLRMDRLANSPCRSEAVDEGREVKEEKREITIRSEILKWLNRLSDALFVAARIANQLDNIDETVWYG